MPLNAEARTLLDLMEAVGAPPLDSLPPEAAREARAALAPPVLEACHDTVDLEAGGVPSRLYRPTPERDAHRGCCCGSTAAAGFSATSRATTTSVIRWLGGPATQC